MGRPAHLSCLLRRELGVRRWALVKQPGQGEVQPQMSRVRRGLGTRTRLAVLTLAQGWCGANSGVGCSVKRADGRGKAQRWTPRPEAQARGAVTRASASRVETAALSGLRRGEPGCPVGLTWRLCSAASSSRCRFAQTSRCSGKVGPGPAMLGFSAASREGGRARRGRPGPASAPGPVRPPRLRPRRGTPRSPRAGRQSRRLRRRRRRRGGRAGRAGLAGAGRGVGPRALLPPAAMATAGRPAPAGDRRGALLSRLGNYARRGSSQGQLLADPGLRRAGVCGGGGGGEGVPGGRGLATAPPAACRGRPRPSADPCLRVRKKEGGKESGGGAVRPGAGPGPLGCVRARVRVRAPRPAILLFPVYPRFPSGHPTMPRPSDPGHRGYRLCLRGRLRQETLAPLPITEMSLNAG